MRYHHHSILIILILTLLLFKCVKIEKIEEYYDNGKIKARYTVKVDKNGNKRKNYRYKSWFEDGIIKADLIYREDTLISGTEWYHNGQEKMVFGTLPVNLRRELMYDSFPVIINYDSLGLKHGMYKSFWSDGRKMFECIYMHGELNGKVSYFEPPPSKAPSNNPGLLWEKEFLNGIENGIRRVYYPSGAKKSELPIVNGVKHGKYTEWYENGKIETECLYKNGELTGILKKYYPDGKLEWEDIYKSTSHIIMITYFSDGTEAGRGELIKTGDSYDYFYVQHSFPYNVPVYHPFCYSKMDYYKDCITGEAGFNTRKQLYEILDSPSMESLPASLPKGYFKRSKRWEKKY